MIGLLAVVWSVPAVARADDPPASPEVRVAAPGPARDPAIVALEARMARIEHENAELRATDAALAAATAGDAEDKEPAFRIYGFIDMGLQKVWTSDDVVIPTRKTTFVLGNINLYFDFHPAPDWSSLVEVRFTNYPAGSERYGIPALGQAYSETSTSAPDPANGDGYNSVKWGTTVLERAYIQWQRHAKLGVRVGQFLTPYGIWNVDHGTPTLLSMFRPQAQVNEMFPEHQVGVEVYGRLDATPLAGWQLDYHAYVSNGRTQGVVALTEDKMVGGRVVASTTRPWAAAFGLSAMRSHVVDQQHNLDVTTGQTLRPNTVSYEEYALGVDGSIDLGGLRLRSEATLRHKTYAADEREVWSPGVYVANGYELDAYAIAAYRIPGTPLEPYAYGEIYRWPTPIGEHLAVASLGLNTYATPAIQLKFQALYSTWLDGLAVFSKPNSDELFASVKLVMGF